MKKPMKNVFAVIVAAIGLTAFAAPTVEITEVGQPTPGSGKVNCSYLVGGLEGKGYDLVLKVEAEDAEKGIVSTNLVFESVAEGATNQTIDCKAVLGKAYPNVTFYAMLDDREVQLWDNGPYWAKCNVGATKPEEAGWYFWWGDTEGYVRNAADDGWVSAKDGTTTIKFSKDDAKAGQSNGKAVDLKTAGWIDESGNLTMAHDAARVNLGGEWRMPTAAEIVDLVEYTTTTWTTQNGVYGRLVKGKGDYSNVSIFIPAAGYGYGSEFKLSGLNGHCWSSTPYSGSGSALYLGFTSSYFRKWNTQRSSGFPVRPVRGSAE